MISQKTSIKFGTDGWRGVISDNFTFGNVRKVAGAVSVFAKKRSARPGIVVGYDTRFLSREFAKEFAQVLKNSGCEVTLSGGFVSTPCLSFNVLERKALLGIMISASHNPSRYNGIKIKAEKGCSAGESVTGEIETKLYSGFENTPGGSIVEADFSKAYLKRLVREVDFEAIKKANLKIISDPMYGAGRGYLSSILEGTRCKCVQIHSNADPLFGGLHPEPIEINLGELKTAVLKNKASCGLATDGDADRIGVVDEKGRYLTPHQVFPLLLYYLTKYKGLKGKVVQTISLGYVSERIARDFNLDFEEVPVGFKYIADKILAENILMGGEESGGYGYGSFMPERDGVLNALMLVEMLAVTKKKLSKLIDEIEKKYGRSCYLRTDFENPGISKDDFVKTLKAKAPGSIGAVSIRQIKDYDGIEFVLEDDSWLLMRPSGTEPIIRVYAEAAGIKKTKRLIEWGEETVGFLINKS